MTTAPMPWHHPLVVTRHDDEAEVYITLSTPLPERTLISDELLHMVNNHGIDHLRLSPPKHGNPQVLLHRAAHAHRTERLGLHCVAADNCWLGWYLHLDARNTSATYRIDHYTHSNAWRATLWHD